MSAPQVCAHWVLPWSSVLGFFWAVIVVNPRQTSIQNQGMKTLLRILCLTGTILSALHAINLQAQDGRFFRIVAPVPTTITEVTVGGWVTWTNDPTNATFTVQTTTALPDETNWVDWVQVPVSDATTVHRVFDPNPPLGMAFIPAGSFLMGATTNVGHESYTGEVPQHTVSVSAFYMDRTEVTKALWDEVKGWNGGNGYDLGSIGSGKATNHPVQTVNWYDCVKWCNARSQAEGLTPCYYTDAGLTVVYKTNVVAPYVKWDADGYRLPTEAEWEKAARGGTPGHRFPWSDSDTIQHSRANYNADTKSGSYDLSKPAGYHPDFATGGYPYTSPVGYFAPNGYGLYDMAGNVREWCWDWYSGTYYSSSPTNDPQGPTTGSYRVFRGGSWSYFAYFCRAADRNFHYPSYLNYYIGFRCVRAAGQ
jgi:formylglycine-generating enzyme required for sulfatase activity